MRKSRLGIAHFVLSTSCSSCMSEALDAAFLHLMLSFCGQIKDFQLFPVPFFPSPLFNSSHIPSNIYSLVSWGEKCHVSSPRKVSASKSSISLSQGSSSLVFLLQSLIKTVGFELVLTEPVLLSMVLPPHSCILPCLCRRAGRGISCHQLVSGAGHTAGQSPVRLMEPHSRRLSVGLSSASHLGHLRQGLCSTQDPPWQLAWLFPLVRLSNLRDLRDLWSLKSRKHFYYLKKCCIKWVHRIVLFTIM